MRRFKRRRVFELFEVVIVRSVPDIHFCFEAGAAFVACLPITLMALVMMNRAQREPVMISVATVAGIREDHVLILVIAYPVPAALRSNEILRFTA